jgi:acyl carrier protein
MSASRSLFLSLVLACAVCLTASSPSRAGVIADRVNAIVMESFGVGSDEFTAQTRFEEDLGADPTHKFIFINELVVGFNIHISTEDADKLLTVGDAIRYCEAHVK